MKRALGAFLVLVPLAASTLASCAPTCADTAGRAAVHASPAPTDCTPQRESDLAAFAACVRGAVTEGRAFVVQPAYENVASGCGSCTRCFGPPPGVVAGAAGASGTYDLYVMPTGGGAWSGACAFVRFNLSWSGTPTATASPFYAQCLDDTPEARAAAAAGIPAIDIARSGTATFVLDRGSRRSDTTCRVGLEGVVDAGSLMDVLPVFDAASEQ